MPQIPGPERGAYDAGSCSACNQKRRVTSWVMVQGPVLDMWEPLVMTCYNENCQRWLEPIRLDTEPIPSE